MMKNTVIETLAGAVVLAAAAYFLIFAAGRTGADVGGDSYVLNAEFSKVGELAVGSDVRVSGIKVGSVLGLELNPQTYNAVVRMNVDKAVELPLDSSARIQSAGLLGGNYLSIIPGADIEMMVDGDRFEFTQGSVDLMDIISQALFTPTENANK